METTRVEAPAQGNSSAKITIAIGLAVAAVGLVFALNTTDAPSHWFAVFKLIHVGVAVFWVGGGLVLTALALWAETKSDPEEMATLARQASFVGERLFAPAGLIVLAMGITMVVDDHIGFGTAWVIIGLVATRSRSRQGSDSLRHARSGSRSCSSPRERWRRRRRRRSSRSSSSHASTSACSCSSSQTC